MRVNVIKCQICSQIVNFEDFIEQDKMCKNCKLSFADDKEEQRKQEEIKKRQKRRKRQREKRRK